MSEQPDIATPDVKTLLARVYTHISLGQYDMVRESCQQILRAYPTNAQACAILGDLAAQESNLPDALHWYQQAVQREPANEVYRRKYDGAIQQTFFHQSEAAPPVDITPPRRQLPARKANQPKIAPWRSVVTPLLAIAIILVLGQLLAMSARKLSSTDEKSGIPISGEAPPPLAANNDRNEQQVHQVPGAGSSAPPVLSPYQQPQQYAADPTPRPQPVASQADPPGNITPPPARLPTVPYVLNQTRGTAVTNLSRKGYAVAVTEEVTAGITPGRVIRTVPRSGTELARGERVTVVVAIAPVRKPEPVTIPVTKVPNVNGLTFDDARSVLRAAGYEISVNDEVAANVNPGRVVRTLPAANTQLARGNRVTIVVSREREKVPAVPNVRGQTLDQARNTLRQAGYQVSINDEAATGVAAGLVTRTDPAAGVALAAGGRITVYLAH